MSALELHPNSACVQTVTAEVELFTNRVATCVKFLRAALRMEPENGSAGSLLPRVELIIVATEAGDRFYNAGLIFDASKEYSHALDFLGSKDGEGRGGYLQSALHLDSEHSWASLTLFRVQQIERLKAERDEAFKFGEYFNAVQRYTETLDMIGSNEEEGGGRPLRAVLLASRANVLLEGYYEEAIKIFCQAQEACTREENGVTERRMNSLERLFAGIARKASRSKDYYGALDVSISASVTELKEAMRSSCLPHPAKAGNPEHFKLVSEAYNAIS
ncbi:hypothetical protein FRB98_000356 [Tulasnella sp. 332]|nr:hypothetical protein FRB98_000356 [Tulasnella sp. 332]